jgi:hypothetical protein
MGPRLGGILPQKQKQGEEQKRRAQAQSKSAEQKRRAKAQSKSALCTDYANAVHGWTAMLEQRRR